MNFSSTVNLYKIMTTQTTALAKKSPDSKPSALNLMASRLSVDPVKLLATLKNTVFAKASDEELMALVVVANEYGLNPFLKELYAFPAKGGGIVPIVSVDGWNKMLVRHPDFDGIEFDFLETPEGELISCTATIFLKNRTHPVKVTEYLDECKRNTEPWNNMPRRMLRNRTLCQASRMAFGFSGVHNEDEAATIVDVSSSPTPTEPPPKLVAAPEKKEITPQGELEAKIIALGFNFDTARKFLIESGIMPDADSIGSFVEIPAQDAKRILRLADKTLKEGMEKLQGAAQ